jgi:uncharacterized protein (TIGR00369 family)
MRRGGAFMESIGPLWARRDADSWRYGLLAGPRHLNPAGIVHGGLLQALMDHALSLLAWEAANRAPCVTLQADTQFLSAAREGEFIVAQGSQAHRTHTLLFMRGQLAVNDRPVLSAQAIFKVSDFVAS